MVLSVTAIFKLIPYCCNSKYFFPSPVISRFTWRYLCHCFRPDGLEPFNPFRTAVPFWGQCLQFLSSLSPKPGCGTKRVKTAVPFSGTNHPNYRQIVPKTGLPVYKDQNGYTTAVHFHACHICTTCKYDFRRDPRLHSCCFIFFQCLLRPCTRFLPFLSTYAFRLLILRGAIVNRTYGLHKNLYVQQFLLAIFGPVNYGPP